MADDGNAKCGECGRSYLNGVHHMSIHPEYHAFAPAPSGAADEIERMLDFLIESPRSVDAELQAARAAIIALFERRGR